MALPAIAHLTAEEYLAWENLQPDKHEYVAGEVFAMAGTTRKHVTVAGNVLVLLSAQLEGTPFRVYMANMKLRVEAADAFFYPDVFVTCDEGDHKADLFMAHSTLIIEVLSPSTDGYDRGEKFAAYRKLPSLREYLLIDPERRQIECFRRGEGGVWTLRDIAPPDAIRLESIGFETSFDALFKRVE